MPNNITMTTTTILRPVKKNNTSIKEFKNNNKDQANAWNKEYNNKSKSNCIRNYNNEKTNKSNTCIKKHSNESNRSSRS